MIRNNHKKKKEKRIHYTCLKDEKLGGHSQVRYIERHELT